MPPCFGTLTRATSETLRSTSAVSDGHPNRAASSSVYRPRHFAARRASGCRTTRSRGRRRTSRAGRPAQGSYLRPRHQHRRPPPADHGAAVLSTDAEREAAFLTYRDPPPPWSRPGIPLAGTGTRALPMPCASVPGSPDWGWRRGRLTGGADEVVMVVRFHRTRPGRRRQTSRPDRPEGDRGTGQKGRAVPDGRCERGTIRERHANPECCLVLPHLFRRLRCRADH